MIKKIFSVVLCLTMLLSLSASAFAEEKKTVNYVSLGASQTWGCGSCIQYPEQFSNWVGTAEQEEAWYKYGFEADAWNPGEKFGSKAPGCGYNFRGYGVISTNSFPWIVKTAIEEQGYEVNFSQLAMNSMKAVDLYSMLNDDYFCQEFFENLSESLFPCITEKDYYEAYNDLRKEYQDAVKSADFISYDFGANEVSNGIADFVYSDSTISVPDPDYEVILEPNDYEQFEIIRDMLYSKAAELFDLYDLDSESAVIIESVLDKTAFGLLSYCCCLDKNLDIIYDCNPDVCVVVLQIQNSYAGEIFTLGDIEVPIGEIMQIATDFLNTYASSLSKYCSKYYYAKITDNQRVEFVCDDIMNYSGPAEITQNLIDILDVEDFDYDIHIKSQLTPEYEKASGTVGDANYNAALNASYDATLQLLSYVFNNYHCSFSGFAEGDVSKMRLIINEMLGEISAAFVSGNGDYTSAIENAKSNFDNLPSSDREIIALLYLNSAFGVYLIHPTANGQKEMAAAVINALENENKGIKSILSGLDYSVKSFRRSFDSIAACVKEIEKKAVEDSISYVTSIVPAKQLFKHFVFH